MKPVSITRVVQKLSYQQLRLAVLSPYPPHILAATLGSDLIRHPGESRRVWRLHAQHR